MKSKEDLRLARIGCVVVIVSALIMTAAAYGIVKFVANLLS